jgi:phosphoribosyl 1,2-cyclic phosphate phosphodiesterase
MHHDLPIMGYRIGPLAYITDMKTIAKEEIPYIEGCDTLVVNALRQQPHHSHQTLAEAVDFAKMIGARQTWLIHSSHDIGRHAEVNASLPANIQMAYDGQVVEIVQR